MEKQQYLTGLKYTQTEMYIFSIALEERKRGGGYIKPRSKLVNIHFGP